jgi:hypothetical protein
MHINKLECLSLTVASTLVLYLQARLEPAVAGSSMDTTVRVGS